MISDRTKKINKFRIDLTKRENKINSSIEGLQNQVDKIISITEQNK